jgi:hypothetical protein
MPGFLHPRDSADPDATITLEVLAVLVVAGLAVSLATSSSAIRDVVLKGGGAALLVLGSYYAARTLKENRADKRVDQILKATELTTASSDAVSGGAVHVLLLLAEDIAKSSGKCETGRLVAIKFVLDCTHTNSPTHPVWTDCTKRRLNTLNVPAPDATSAGGSGPGPAAG